MTRVNETDPFISQKCTIRVEEGEVSPIVTMNDTNYASLATAVYFADANKSIELTAGDFTLSSQLVINKPLTISGAIDVARKPLTNLIADEAAIWPTTESGAVDNSKTNLISIAGSETGNVTLNNIRVKGSKASGINAQSAMKTVLNNVYLQGNANAGLLVHFTVEATGLHTEQNGWGGVNVDKGSTALSSSFKFDATSSFEEPSKIWSEITDKEDIVTAPEGWTSYLGKGGAGNTTNMRYWINSKLGIEFVSEFPSNSKYKNTYFVYANGQPITVSPSKEGYIKVCIDDTDDSLEISESDNPVIFGGAKYADVESSHITMTGGKVSMIFGGGYLGNVGNVDVAITGGRLEGYFVGGGYGPKAKFSESRKTADVTGKITAKISNAYVRYLISGGMEHARTEATDIKVTGDNTDILYGLGGGFAPVGINQSLETSYDEVANRTNTANFSMTGGKISGCFYIGGGYSYSYTKDITATFNGVAVEGGMKGVGSNGRSNTVTATFTGCNFSKGESAYTPGIAAVNRGKADTVSMSFNNCTFTNDIKCYLGADANWQDGNYPVPVSGKAIFTFTGANVPVVQLSEGMQNVTLTGAKATADVFLKKAGTEIKAFTIPADKTWNFNNGLTIANDVTLTKTGTLAVKDTLTLSKVDQLAMALSSVIPVGTIDLSSVTAEAMLAQLNAGEKKALTSGICILCSDATVYTDMASAQLSSATGTIKYIKLDGETYSLGESVALTVAPTITTPPTAITIEAGQPLSASILTGGEAKVTVEEREIVVNGVFSWMNPSDIATVGTKSYKVIFTPTDQTKYKVVKDIEVEIKDVKQYYTVTLGKCDNGKIEVTDGNSAGKYEDKQVLTVKAIPNDHYDFSAWGTGITGTADNGSYTVSKDDVLSATFVAKNYTVTIGKNVKVTKQDGTSVSTGDLPYGTILNVVAAPTEEVGSLESLICNDKEVINNTVMVDGALNIQATFNAVVPSTYRISLGENVKNGKIQLFDKNGNAIAFGSTLAEGTVVSVVTVPDPGYELDGNVATTGATYADNKFTVAQTAVTVSATFKPKKYKVEISAENATITLSKTEGLDATDYGTSITITEAKAADDYKLLAVVVNGKEIAKDESFIVKGDTKVNAVVQKLPDVVFMETIQTYTYNKEAQAFVVRTVPAGISGITITYKQGEFDVKDPTDAGTYKVLATLKANSSYASMDKKAIGTLIIEKAPYPAAAIPTVSSIKEGEGENEYHWKSVADGNFRTAYYKLPANSNYREPEFVIPKDESTENSLTKVILGGNNWIKTRSSSTPVSLTLNATGGSVSVWNGDVQVTDATPLYAGQKLTLKAIPANATYYTRPTWSKNVNDEDGVASITLPESNATVTATFAEKTEAPLTAKDYTSVYTGTAFGTKGAPTVTSDVSGWVVSFKQDDVTVNEPTDVGYYTIKASRSEDDVYKATTVTVGTLHITETKAVISDVAGTDITTIQTLNQSVISGTANVEGTFSWVNPDAKLSEGTHADIAVLFTPADKNYAPVRGTATVTVTPLAGEVAVRTIELTENDPANGNGVVLTLNGTVVTAGTTVKAGDKLTATFSAKSGYTASATINGVSYARGSEYQVNDGTGNVAVAVTYTKNSTVNPDPNVDVTGVSLDKSELTLVVKGTYTLKATVTPSDATNQKVTWESSDEKIATVDKDGKVTAIAIGKAMITVITDDGGKTATCAVTVDAATGLEELIADTRVYGQDHAIRIVPAMSVNVLVVSMNGKVIYNDMVSSVTRIPVPAAGIYIVKLGTGNGTSVRKVSVK